MASSISMVVIVVPITLAILQLLIVTIRMTKRKSVDSFLRAPLNHC